MLSPNPMPDRHAVGQRDDVLHRAADSCRRRRGSCTGGSTPSCRPPGAAGAVSSSVHATTVAAGWRCAISRARFGPGDHGDPVLGHVGDLADDLAHPLRGAQLDALHQADQDGVRREVRAQPVRFSRSIWDGRASTTTSAPPSASAGRWSPAASAAARRPGGTPGSRGPG